jgi:hypothetical protein
VIPDLPAAAQLGIGQSAGEKKQETEQAEKKIG